MASKTKKLDWQSTFLSLQQQTKNTSALETWIDTQKKSFMTASHECLYLEVVVFIRKYLLNCIYLQ